MRFKKSMLLIIATYLSIAGFAQPECSTPFSVVYQTLSVQSEEKYVEALHYIYQSKNQQEVDTRRAQAGNISVPYFGSAEFNTNKGKVDKVYQAFKSNLRYSLSIDDKISLTSTYHTNNDAQAAMESWLSCIKITSERPYMTYEQDSASVIVTIFMKPNDYRTFKDSVQVRGIFSSSNLTLDQVNSDFKDNGYIKYSGTYTLRYKRKDHHAAYVRVNLTEGQIVPVRIPGISKKAVYEEKTEINFLQADVVIDVSKNFMKILSQDQSLLPDQTLRFPNQDRSHYILNLELNTKFKSDSVSILYFIYIPKTGGVDAFAKKNPGLKPDRTLTLPFKMITGAKDMTGKFLIIYGKEKRVCVNCNN